MMTEEGGQKDILPTRTKINKKLVQLAGLISENIQEFLIGS